MSATKLSLRPRRNARFWGSTVTTPLDDWACAHPFFDMVFKWLVRQVEALTEPVIFLVVGPTGVGKTTMMQYLAREFARRCDAAMNKNASLLPTLTTEAQYTPGRGFDWHGLFEGLLVNANDILIDRKIGDNLEETRGSLRALQRAANKVLLYRAPALVMVDEGSALLEGEKAESLLKNLRFLKGLGNMSKTHIAIFGDYRLAKLASFDGQLNRRIYLTHFPGYPATHEREFSPVVARFEGQFRSKGIDCSLVDSSHLLFERTCGCVGLLRRWVLEAYLESLDGDKTIHAELLKKKGPVDTMVNRWKQEILDGMKGLEDFNNQMGVDPSIGGVK